MADQENPHKFTGEGVPGPGGINITGVEYNKEGMVIDANVFGIGSTLEAAEFSARHTVQHLGEGLGMEDSSPISDSETGRRPSFGFSGSFDSNHPNRSRWQPKSAFERNQEPKRPGTQGMNNPELN